MGWNNNFRDCDRFWDDLMFGRCRHRDCDDRRCRRIVTAIVMSVVADVIMNATRSRS